MSGLCRCKTVSPSSVVLITWPFGTMPSGYSYLSANRRFLPGVGEPQVLSAVFLDEGHAVGVEQPGLPRALQVPLTVEDQHRGVFLVVCDDVASLADHYTVMRPSAPCALRIGDIRPVVDPLVHVLPAADTHGCASCGRWKSRGRPACRPGFLSVPPGGYARL